MRTILAAATFLFLAVAIAVPAAAQQLEPQIRLRSGVAGLALNATKDTGEVTFTVTNAGSLSGQVTLNAAPIDEWRFDFVESPNFMLAAGASRDIRLKVTSSELSQNATLAVTGNFLESGTGRASQPVTSEVALSYEPAAIPPLPPPPPGPPWPMIGTIAGTILLALMVFQVGSIRLELSSPRLEVTPAGSGYVRVTVTNRWWPPRRVYLRVRDVPSPAVAALSLAKVKLRRGESVSVPVLVKAPVEMPDGPQTLSVQARAGFFGPWTSRKKVRLTFRAPLAPDAPLEPLAPIILQN